MLIEVSGAIDGDVTGDVIAAAQTITITGTVDGDVRRAGQAVSITGEVSRSGTVFAANLTVGDTGSFGDDAVAAARRITIARDVGRDVVVSVGRLIIDGSVGGSVTYVSDDAAQIADGAVDGTVERIEPPQTPPGRTSHLGPCSSAGSWSVLRARRAQALRLRQEMVQNICQRPALSISAAETGCRHSMIAHTPRSDSTSAGAPATGSISAAAATITRATDSASSALNCGRRR